jgi:hypothetical protein
MLSVRVTEECHAAVREATARTARHFAMEVE